MMMPRADRYRLISDDTAKKPNENIAQDFQNIAFNHPQIHTMIIILICGAYASIITMVVAMPVMSFTPEGFFDSNGMFNLISNGFEKHTLTATAVFGVCTVFIGFFRFASVAYYTRSTVVVILQVTLLLLTQVSGILTTRNDVFREHHLAVAAVWISSSILFLGSTTVFNREYRKVNSNVMVVDVVWSAAAVASVAFLIFVVVDVFEDERLNRIMAGVFEFTCAGLILLCDGMLIYSIQSKFL